MKPADFIVHIPEPCHEDWNKMQPDAKGKFCNSCSKSVFDFSDKTDAEIKTILTEHKDQKVCGHFRKSQVDRPLNITLDPGNIPGNMSITRTFAVALFLVFGSILFSCKDENGNEVKVQHDIPQLVIRQMEALPPAQDSVHAFHAAIGENSEDYPTEVYVTEGSVSGGISFGEDIMVDIPHPPTNPPKYEEHIAGALSYEVYEPGRENKDALSGDSLIKNGDEQLVESLELNQYKIFSVYPNPSAGEFTISYELQKRSDVSIAIYDMNGALVRSVVNTKAQYEGRYRIPLSLPDLSDGIYIVSMICGDKQIAERLAIAK